MFALWLVESAVQQAILLDKLPGLDDDSFARELVRVWLGYLHQDS